MLSDKQLLDFLLNNSKRDLQDAFLRHLSASRNKRKEIGDALEQWIEEESAARLVSWFLNNGAEVAAKLNAAAPPLPTTLPRQPFALPKAFNRPRRRKFGRI